ncbi:hypothetical protein IFM89_011426 [Coptis chinensis]|uniref:Serine/threonine specific protein phosphatases domain-containing protein n=1 Tax=Coptis chinensis TaxID=261450 RepID=A0A835IZK1_9MAGN|nr:hypothetical protein IFM89_011426 [Coptis chinensis]
MHGGLSQDLRSLDQIRNIAHPVDVLDQGLLGDLLWADPDKDIKGWGENDKGVSYTFGPDKLVTIFSAPNYCGEFDNVDAMMSVDDSLICSFQILKPSDKKGKIGFSNISKLGTPPHKGGKG